MSFSPGLRFGRTVHHVRNHRRSAAVLVLILLVTGLSGCLDNPFGKKTDDDAKARTIGFRLPSDPGDDTRTPSGCQGCIPLERPADAPALPDPVPPEPPRQLVVALPHEGDRLRVVRTTPEASPAEVPFPWPAEETLVRIFEVSRTSGPYGPLFDERDHGAGIVFHETGDDGRSLQLLLESGATRVEAIHRSIPIVTVAEGIFSDDVRLTSMEHHEHPRALSLFEFGAHLWGRTLRVGEIWAVPGAPSLHETQTLFVYTVERIGADTATVRVDVRTPDRTTMTWRLDIQEGDPYPTHVRALDPSYNRGGALQLGGSSDLAVTLLDRGTDPLHWKTVAAPTHTHASYPMHGYRIDNGRVPPLADDRLLYPLDVAMEDLRGQDPVAREYLDRRPVVLVEARLEPVWRLGLLGQGLPDGVVGTIRWSLIWIDSSGATLSRTVERFLFEDYRVAPAAHRITSTVHHDRTAEELDRVARSIFAAVPLRGGAEAFEALTSRGVGGPADWAAWRLEMAHYDMQATLAIGHLAAPDPVRPSPSDEGVAVVDAASGDLLSFTILRP